MKCPFCSGFEDRVTDTREIEDASVIRRRRECLQCKGRFTTYERIEPRSFFVIKRDARREPFNREKLMLGIRKACEKRPISIEEMERIVDRAEALFHKSPKKEIESKVLGGFVMDELHNLDEVAYVRFASVYRRFKSVDEFQKEIERRFKRS
jgi:transcriptional repressor NrdR